mgnify:FL=1
MMLKNKNNEQREMHNKKGEKAMKKNIMVVLMALIVMMNLTGCGNMFRKDKEHATLSVTTSDGKSYIGQTVNGSNATVTGKTLALEHKSKIRLKKGETAHIIFTCDACGDKQEFDIDQPGSEVIHCKCPEDIDENGNAKEYSAIVISYESTTES